MSKNITIKEGGTSRSFTAEKLRTNLQGGGTCDWVPLDEIDQYVELEELAVTENGFYYPQSKVGFSRVSVDVQGGGDTPVVPSGTPIRGTAAEDIRAGDCVYIIKGGSGGVAPIAPTSFTGSNVYIASFDDNYLYLNTGADYAQRQTIYKVPIRDLTVPLEVYKDAEHDGVTDWIVLSRRIIAYRTVVNNVYTPVIENLKTGASMNDKGLTSGSTYAGAFMGQHAFNCLTDGVWYDIDTMNQVLPYWGRIAGYSYSNGRVRPLPNGKAVACATANVYSNPTTGYIIVNADGTVAQVVNVDTAFWMDTNLDGTMNVIGYKMIVYTNSTNSSGKYELGYYDLEANDGVFHKLKDSNGNIVEASVRGIIKFNAEGTMLWATLGTNGLAVIYEDASVAVYSNITGYTIYNEMFGDYFLENEGHLCYYIPQGTTIGKTTDKNHAGSLGFVQVDIPAGAEGNAIEMFR